MPTPDLQLLKTWNHRAHVYLGLFLLVFLWLFAVSGLLLNHGWPFTGFWDQRRQTTTERAIELPNGADDLGRAKQLMKQLDIGGEIEWPAAQRERGRFDFRVVRPGRIVEVNADVMKGTARVQETRVNGWGVVRVLHTFTGVRGITPAAGRDWWLTKVWSITMDALAVGMILLVGSSLVMAWERREKWLGAGIALGLGLAVCAFFVFGLRWL